MSIAYAYQENDPGSRPGAPQDHGAAAETAAPSIRRRRERDSSESKDMTIECEPVAFEDHQKRLCRRPAYTAPQRPQSPGRPAVRGFLFPDILPSERQLQFALVRQLFAKRPGKPIKEGTVLLHEADDHVRACPLCAAGWRSGVTVNLLADFEGVSGTAGFFHSRCLDRPAIAHKRRRGAPHGTDHGGASLSKRNLLPTVSLKAQARDWGVFAFGLGGRRRGRGFCCPRDGNA